MQDPKEEVRRSARETAQGKVEVLNRREMRRLGSRFGFYRMPKRAASRKAATRGHWLPLLLAEQREARARVWRAVHETSARNHAHFHVGGRRNGKHSAASAWQQQGAEK